MAISTSASCTPSRRNDEALRELKTAEALSPTMSAPLPPGPTYRAMGKTAEAKLSSTNQELNKAADEDSSRSCPESRTRPAHARNAARAREK